VTPVSAATTRINASLRVIVTSVLLPDRHSQKAAQ
jgi:hypothetical protein